MPQEDSALKRDGNDLPRRQVSVGSDGSLQTAGDVPNRTVSGEVSNRNVSGQLAEELEDAKKKEDAQIIRMPSEEFARKAMEFKNASNQRGLLVETVLDEKEDCRPADDKKHVVKKKGAFSGVFVPTCENMWGVLIFLRFHFIVGEAGIGQALCAVLLSFSCAFCTTSSMSATVSSGGIVSKGGPYYMISRALGPEIGASMGIIYWLAFTMLAVLETLGAVEGVLMAAPHWRFDFCEQAFGTVGFISLVLMVWGGINFVTKMGLFFCFVVFFTLFIYYYGLLSSPSTAAAEDNPWVTGPSAETLWNNWGAHYNTGVSFGTVLSVFFPCFTGILSGANRADILKDPPKNLRHGTFGAIIFSLFMYSSFMILWGSVADYRYLQGQSSEDGGRRLAGGGGGNEKVVTEIVWNPFPHAAHLGIIVSSLSQALQCLVVAPKLLQAIAKDKILSVLNCVAPVSRSGEPVRALVATYSIGALMVLMGRLDLVAPLLSMCFLTAYMYMNLSCFTLTRLKSSAWRPSGIHRKRWRIWYSATSGCGSIICIVIMFTINHWWALVAFAISISLYLYINWKMEQRGWGNALDGIRFQLALTSLIQLESSQNHKVNWRPQVLILYRIHLADELKGIKHHEILRFYSQLRKSRGFCVVACVLEADLKDEHAIHKARIEKEVIKTIMKEEAIQGFAEVVVSPSWVEGTNYIIQLTGIGGLAPNTVLLDWPENWQRNPKKASDFINVLNTAYAGDKAVLAVKGLRDIPTEVVHGTIDIWWMIHDGGFLVLLSWLLVQHRVWRKCHLRIFTITENVTEQKAQAAAEMLTKTLRQRRLFDVDVEVILADNEMIEPYTFDWDLRLEDRHSVLKELNRNSVDDLLHREIIPFEIKDLFDMAEETSSKLPSVRKDSKELNDLPTGQIIISDIRKETVGMHEARSAEAKHKATETSYSSTTVDMDTVLRETTCKNPPKIPGSGVIMDDKEPGAHSDKPRSSTSSPAELIVDIDQGAVSPKTPRTPPVTEPEKQNVAQDSRNSDTDDPDSPPKKKNSNRISHSYVNPNIDNSQSHKTTREPFLKLNQIILSRSKRAQLVVMNLPDQWGTEEAQVFKFMSYCDTLTKGLDRVLFVHSSGHEVFDITQ